MVGKKIELDCKQFDHLVVLRTSKFLKFYCTIGKNYLLQGSQYDPSNTNHRGGGQRQEA